MSNGYRISKDLGAYFLTFQIVGWVDIFTRKAHRDIAIESLRYCIEKKGLNLFAWVIMSNHIHILAQAENQDMSGIIRDFKHFTSLKFLEYINKEYESRKDWMNIVFEYYGKYKQNQNNQIWTHENHPEQVYSQKFIEQKICYIHNNPVRAGIVEKPEDYLYSSARSYADLNSLLPIVKVDFLWKTI